MSANTKTLAEAAQAVLDRWDSPQWEWRKHGPTADLMHDLRGALDEQAKAQDVTQDGPDYGPAWLGVASARVMAQPGIAAKHLRDYAELLKAQAQAESVAVPDGRLKALEAAVSALYFDEGSDFRAALGSVIRYLDERLAGDMLCHPKAAYDRVQAMLAAPQPSQAQAEPTWTPDECARVLETLRYVQGIAERSEGRQMREDETLEAFVLGYVKRLEAAQAQAEPYAWAVSGLGRPFYGEFAEQDARAEARRCGGTSEAFPLYRHSAQPKRQPLTRERVKQIMEENGYDMASPQERSDFVNGLRHGESAHGIGAKG